jgi:hypothetical protein
MSRGSMFDPMETNRPAGAALGNAADYRLASSASNEERRRNFVRFLTLPCRMNPHPSLKETPPWQDWPIPRS